ncbi:hypothetical protein LTR53_009447 [Teratosphaeriaceae sp. CCFEE 6253]|nr:hypothetical protein LTR53_009447 [Teratosphaeriaceae sp. CCFEE 6253]
MTKLLVVTGATGNQGTAVIKYFQQHEPSFNLRGLTRNANSSAAIALASSGVEIIEADNDDVASLKHAFRGAHAIFAYTAFSAILLRPEIMGRVVAGELPPPVGQYAFPLEVQQGNNIADAAASVPGLHRLIWSSLSSSKKWSKGKYTQGFHFDSKEDVKVYMNSLGPLKGKVSCVQMGGFADNLIKMPERFGLAMGSDGKLHWETMLIADRPFPWIDVERDTGAFVSALIDAPGGTQVVGASQYITLNQYLKLLCDHLGVAGTYKRTAFEDNVKDDPTHFKLELAEVYAYVMEFGYDGGDPEVITPDELERRGFSVPRGKIADHVKRSDWSHLVPA